jgi:hypothetical protein
MKFTVQHMPSDLPEPSAVGVEVAPGRFRPFEHCATKNARHDNSVQLGTRDSQFA